MKDEENMKRILREYEESEMHTVVRNTSQTVDNSLQTVEYPSTGHRNLHALSYLSLPCRFLDASEETVDYRLLAMKMALSSDSSRLE